MRVLVIAPDAEGLLVARRVRMEELEVAVADSGASPLPDLHGARLAALEEHAALLDRRSRRIPRPRRRARALRRCGPVPASADRRQLERMRRIQRMWRTASDIKCRTRRHSIFYWALLKTKNKLNQLLLVQLIDFCATRTRYQIGTYAERHSY